MFDFVSPANDLFQAKTYKIFEYDFGEGQVKQRFAIGVVTNAYNTCFHRGASGQDEYIRNKDATPA